MKSAQLPAISSKGLLAICVYGFLTILATWISSGISSGQEINSAWEYTPYRVQIWISDDGKFTTAPTLRDRLTTELSQLFEVAGFSEFTASVSWMPAEIRWAQGEPPTQLDVPRMRQAAKDIVAYDKLFLVQLKGGASERLEVSEFDMHLRHWSEPESAAVETDLLLAESIFSLIKLAFRPILQLENPNEKLIWGRPRAIQLANSPESLIHISPKSILWPATRYNDRAGEPLAKEGIVPADFTRLSVKEIRANRVLCDIYSGIRNPFRKRMGVRSERYALLVKPRYSSTKLEIVKRTEEADPLIDYEIYEKPFNPDEEPKLLGRTDFLGRLDVVRDPAAPLKILYVKCGNQLLARLPIVPGELQSIRVPIGDDELRLQAEGFILGMQSATLDAYGRRLELAARFKRRLDAKEFEKAEAMIPEARLLPNRTQLMQALDQREPTFTTTNPRVQSRIDLLFGEGRKLINSFPDSDLTSQLTADLAKARSASTTP